MQTHEAHCLFSSDTLKQLTQPSMINTIFCKCSGMNDDNQSSIVRLEESERELVKLNHEQSEEIDTLQDDLRASRENLRTARRKLEELEKEIERLRPDGPVPHAPRAKRARRNAVDLGGAIEIDSF